MHDRMRPLGILTWATMGLNMKNVEKLDFSTGVQVLVWAHQNGLNVISV